MKWNRIITLIVAAALAGIALLFLQLKWIQRSTDLVEEQFEQKVQMALCSAVDAARNGGGSGTACATVSNQLQCRSVLSDSVYQSGELESALADALAFYHIPGPYDLAIVDRRPPSDESTYCCSLTPLIQTEDHLLSISFPGREDYVRSELGFMFLSSAIIMLFITTVFVLACYTLLRQKYLHQINIDFFNNMAHELRTPLTNIGLATRILQKKKSELRNDRYLQIVERENQRMQQQVERVLHLASLDNGQYQLDKKRVELGGLLREVIGDLEIQIQDKGARVDLEMKATTVVVTADRFHLSNAFRNLLDNALKYAGGQPHIRILVQPLEGGVRIRFEDNGIGIDAKDQAAIFKKFQRSDPDSAGKPPGFGLGLAYVKMIIERHEGWIQVFSELNRGSRFNLFLPELRHV